MRQQFKVLSGKLKRPGQRLQEVALFDEAGVPLSLGGKTKLVQIPFTRDDFYPDDVLAPLLVYTAGADDKVIMFQFVRVIVQFDTTEPMANPEAALTTPTIVGQSIHHEDLDTIWDLPNSNNSLVFLEEDQPIYLNLTGYNTELDAPGDPGSTVGEGVVGLLICS